MIVTARDLLEEAPLPYVVGGFGTIVADPPWDYTAGKASRIAPRYRTMSAREIGDLPIGALAAQRSMAFVWCTSSFLAEGLWVLRRWGYEYKSQIVWVKGRIEECAETPPRRLVLQIGMGSYVRLAHELCLIGVRGNLTGADRAVPSVILAPRGEHSQKPDELLEAAERLAPGPRLELFARRRRFGWSAWGDQLPGKDNDGQRKTTTRA